MRWGGALSVRPGLQSSADKQSKLGIKTLLAPTSRQAGRISNVQKTPRPPPGAPNFPKWFCRIGPRRGEQVKHRTTRSPQARARLNWHRAGAGTPAHSRVMPPCEPLRRKLGTRQAWGPCSCRWGWGGGVCAALGTLNTLPTAPTLAPGEALVCAGQGRPPSSTAWGPVEGRVAPPPRTPGLASPSFLPTRSQGDCGGVGLPGTGCSPGTERAPRWNSRHQTFIRT